jgi:hypothetical protein
MTRGIAVLLIVGLLAGTSASAARIPMRGGSLARSLERRSAPSMASILRRDLSRDRVTPPRILSRDRVVNRYTTLPRAKGEARKGLAAGTHLTSRVRPGRPLTARSAQSRLGLPTRPQARERVLLPQGTSVRFNKALGGKPGVGEITIVKPAPRTVLRDVRRIR